MALVKRITKIGNSWGVILPADILSVAGMKPGSECEVEVKKDVVQLRPHRKRKKKDNQIAEAMSRFINKYRADLKKLA